MIAAFGLGAGWAALDRAIRYSATRIQGSGPLSGKQGFTHKLIVPHAVRLEAARALVESVAMGIDAGEGTDGRLVADGALDGELPNKADHRFDGVALAAMSRIFARDTALRVACDGLRWVTAASAAAVPALDAFRLDAACVAQEGLIADMDRVADVLYGRVGVND
jgi:alkylation response protein AidB-like acyl-CoA dehydrogenase